MTFAYLLRSWSPLGQVLFWLVFAIFWILFTWKVYIPFSKWFLKSKKRVAGMMLVFSILGILVLATREHDLIWYWYWPLTIFFGFSTIFQFKSIRDEKKCTPNSD